MAVSPTGRAPLFAQQLRRAAAQRGQLDPLYRELSDHWTRILQRLYPVWALIGPGLSDPGHIEIHSRTIYLDADALLGPRERIAAGNLERRALLRCFGVALHETMHAKHTKRWAVEHELALAASEQASHRQLAIDRQLLEEPRMEAHGVREQPPGTLRGRFVRAALQTAVLDVILPAFAAVLAGTPASRDLVARAHVYLTARYHYGIVDSAMLAPLQPVWRALLGAADLRALDELYARLIWIADGELEPLDRAAREYREIVGAPDPPPSGAGGQREGGQDGGDGAAGGDMDEPSGGAESGDENSDAPPTGGDTDERTCSAGEDTDHPATRAGSRQPESLADALERALAAGREVQLEQFDADPELLEQLRAACSPPPPGTSRRAGTGLPSGRLPDRGVDRPPHPDEIAQGRRYANRLRQALAHGTRTIDKRTPGGRFDGRAHARGQAQRATGRPVSSHPWRTTRRVKAPLEQPHVGLIIDTSGSMGRYEYALGPIAWIITDGLRQIGGRCATALFGNAVSLLADGSRPLPLVPALQTGGGTAYAGDALELVADSLDLVNPRRPRFVYVLSDGGWADTRTGVERIRLLAGHGVPTIHIAIGAQPLAVECDRITVIQDPADALDVVSADTVAALRAGTWRRGS